MNRRVLLAALCLVVGLSAGGCKGMKTDADYAEQNRNTIELVESGAKSQGVVTCIWRTDENAEVGAFMDVIHEHGLRVISISRVNTRMDMLIERDSQ